jgi:hypothetical protein
MNITCTLRGIIAAGLLLTIVPSATAKYSGGSGTPQDPYQIATAADLIALGQTPADYGKHFVLTADIDLDPNLPGRKVFGKAVIAPDTDWRASFGGVFDGNGHTISHLTIAGEGGLALFGALDEGAMIANLGLEAVDVNGTGPGVGGLVGMNCGRIAASYSTGSVNGAGAVGGLVGANYYRSSIANRHSSALVSGCCSSVGGLVGANHGPITNSYSSGLVSGAGYVGGLVGWNGAIVETSFWDIQTSGQSKSAGGTGKTMAEMRAAKTFLNAGWDFVDETANGTEDIWWIDEGKDYPRLWWEAVPR